MLSSHLSFTGGSHAVAEEDVDDEDEDAGADGDEGGADYEEDSEDIGDWED
jgi:hypothetical protein